MSIEGAIVTFLHLAYYSKNRACGKLGKVRNLQTENNCTVTKHKSDILQATY
jgi:hypothetical protein